MAKKADIEKKTEELLKPVAEEFGVRIYDVEYVKEGKDYFLRAYIDKDGGVNIGDCENVSRRLSDILDREDPVGDAYTLEVSSPGLGRKLTKDRHFQNSIGEEVEISYYGKTGDDSVTEGVLISADKDSFVVECDGVQSSIVKKDVKTVRLKIDF
ncbi:MAG: ribosome maturation factor RimP [Lachnospiraceae bacterium]|nr:ribosome maturation factor RimP [Lachnospiraceae bacterium]